MRGLFLLLLTVVGCFSCDSKLTDKQRKALRDEMEEREIKKIGQEKIYQKALARGREVSSYLKEDSEISALEDKFDCTITKITSAEGLSDKEREVYEAYAFALGGTDNVQKEGMEWLIYSKPVEQNDSLQMVWFVKFKRKSIIQLL